MAARLEEEVRGAGNLSTAMMGHSHCALERTPLCLGAIFRDSGRMAAVLRVRASKSPRHRRLHRL